MTDSSSQGCDLTQGSQLPTSFELAQELPQQQQRRGQQQQQLTESPHHGNGSISAVSRLSFPNNKPLGTMSTVQEGVVSPEQQGQFPVNTRLLVPFHTSVFQSRDCLRSDHILTASAQLISLSASQELLDQPAPRVSMDEQPMYNQGAEEYNVDDSFVYTSNTLSSLYEKDVSTSAELSRNLHLSTSSSGISVGVSSNHNIRPGNSPTGAQKSAFAALAASSQLYRTASRSEQPGVENGDRESSSNGDMLLAGVDLKAPSLLRRSTLLHRSCGSCMPILEPSKLIAHVSGRCEP